MCHLARNPFGRLLAQFLIVALVAPMFAWQAGQAGAQMYPTRIPISVVVLDFQDVTKMEPEGTLPDPYLADTIKPAVWTELHENPWFQPLPQNDVDIELQDTEHYQKPYNLAEQVRLARRLQAKGVLTGFVQYLGMDPVKSVVSIRVQAMLLDELTERYIMGATVEASSDPQPGADERTLLNDAIKQAAAKLVTKLANYKVPEGSVQLASKVTAIKINIGETSGLKEGQRLTLLRVFYDRERKRSELQKVGRLVAYEVQRDSSLCSAEEAPSGVIVSDRVRAIWYEEPIGPVPEGVVPPGAGLGKKTHIGKILVAAGLLYIITSMVMSSRSTWEPRVSPREIGFDPKDAYGAPRSLDAQVAPSGKLSETLFSWDAVGGATDYEIQISTDQTFAPAKTLRHVVAARFPAGMGREQVRLDRLDADQFFAGSTASLWWRVGVRSDIELLTREHPGFWYSDARELKLETH